jgi:hypothetical protein
MNDQPRQRLFEIVSKHGVSVTEDARRCEGLLRDLCGDYPREINLLVGALRQRIPVDLLTASVAIPTEVLLAQMTKRLLDEQGIGEEFACWAVESWALALGKVTSVPAKRLASPAGPHILPAIVKPPPVAPIGSTRAPSARAPSPIVTGKRPILGTLPRPSVLWRMPVLAAGLALLIFLAGIVLYLQLTRVPPKPSASQISRPQPSAPSTKQGPIILPRTQDPTTSPTKLEPATLPTTHQRPALPWNPSMFFTSSAEEIVTGTSTVLAWAIEGASKVELDGATVPSRGTKTVSPTEITTYNLAAYGPGDSTEVRQVTIRVTETKTIEIVPAADLTPTVVSFEAVPTTIDQCAIVLLRWKATGATTISIDPTIGIVTQLSGYKVVRPLRSTRYTLKADGPGGTASRDVTTSAVVTPAAGCGK